MASVSNTRLPFVASDYKLDGKLHVLLAASGSVATIKLPLIVRKLGSSGHPVSIRIILTASALQFLQGQSAEQPSLEYIKTLPAVEDVYLDSDEWSVPWVRNAGILHIELRKWAHVMVVAPLSANTLAKIVNGISDNLLTSTIRAWDTSGKVDQLCLPNFLAHLKRKLIVVAPAMNTAMWEHPVTEKQLAVLEREWGHLSENGYTGWFRVLRPQVKSLACGDTGNGAMMEWSSLTDEVLRITGLQD